MTIKTSDAEILRTGKKVITIEAGALSLSARALDKNFTAAAKLVAGIKGRVIVTGIGKSGLVGRKISATLSSTGTPSAYIHPVECLHGDMGLLSPDDAVIAISYSGETAEINSLIPIFKEKKLPVIAITGNKSSRLARQSNITLAIRIKSEACPHNITPTASTTATLALGDALAVALMKMRNFGKQDFAKLHPGGSLGKILSVTVADLMRTGKNNPVVRETATLSQLLKVMTATRLGAASVINSAGKLSGFFTDGDLRRLIQKGMHVSALTAKALMTPNPTAVSPQTMAIDAARIMSEKRIDNLPVVDSKKRPVGIIDERDLLDFIPLAGKNDYSC